MNENDKAVRVLAAILDECELHPGIKDWAIAPDLRDDTLRNSPTQWVLNERPWARIDDDLGDAIRAEQLRLQQRQEQ